MVPGHGSGITVYISYFNSLLERTRQLFSPDSSDLHGIQVLSAIDSIEPVKSIEERLDSSYHQRAKQQILASSGMLLEALEGYKQSAGEDIGRYFSALDFIVYFSCDPSETPLAHVVFGNNERSSRMDHGQLSMVADKF
jgi:hypothetical protein